MTNICGLRIFTRNHAKIMQVQRQDGKTLEFTSPILVEDLLQKFPGAGAGVGLSNKSHHLPLTYKLKLGKMYYLLPKPTPEAEPTKRIKVLITKQQLQELVSKQISVQDVLMAQEADKQSPLSYPYWRPELQSIPEEDESSMLHFN